MYFLKGTILLESSKMRYTGANNERFCKQWKGISFCPPPLIGLLAEVYPFPLVGEFPKPPAECWRNSDRTPQNCDGYASLIKEKPEAGHYATASGFPNTLTVLLLFLLLFLFFLFFLFNLKQAVHVGLDRLQFLVFLPQPFEILIGGFFLCQQISVLRLQHFDGRQFFTPRASNARFAASCKSRSVSWAALNAGLSAALVFR